MARNAAYLEKARRREARHLRKMERLNAQFEDADSMEAELRINDELRAAAKAASKAVRRRLRAEGKAS